MFSSARDLFINALNFPVLFATHVFPKIWSRRRGTHILVALARREAPTTQMVFYRAGQCIEHICLAL